jgi:hypothetical protein
MRSMLAANASLLAFLKDQNFKAAEIITPLARTGAANRLAASGAYDCCQAAAHFTTPTSEL